MLVEVPDVVLTAFQMDIRMVSVTELIAYAFNSVAKWFR